MLRSWQCWNVQSRHSELHWPQRAKKVCDQDLVRITLEQILSHTNCGDANSFGANSKLKQYHTKTWLTMITINKLERLCIHRHMHESPHVWTHCTSFWFRSYIENHYLSRKIALLYFHYILLMQLATILATIHDVLQMLCRLNQMRKVSSGKIS
jgi:hypothetical protein